METGHVGQQDSGNYLVTHISMYITNEEVSRGALMTQPTFPNLMSVLYNPLLVLYNPLSILLIPDIELSLLFM